jgi:hypothetical protein
MKWLQVQSWGNGLNFAPKKMVSYSAKSVKKLMEKL